MGAAVMDIDVVWLLVVVASVFSFGYMVGRDIEQVRHERYLLDRERQAIGAIDVSLD